MGLIILWNLSGTDFQGSWIAAPFEIIETLRQDKTSHRSAIDANFLLVYVDLVGRLVEYSLY